VAPRSLAAITGFLQNVQPLGSLARGCPLARSAQGPSGPSRETTHHKDEHLEEHAQQKRPRYSQRRNADSQFHEGSPTTRQTSCRPSKLQPRVNAADTLQGKIEPTQAPKDWVELPCVRGPLKILAEGANPGQTCHPEFLRLMTLKLHSTSPRRRRRCVSRRRLKR
jgi:hypothetical protein